MPAEVFTPAAAEAAIERMERGQAFLEQAEEWSSSLRLFVEHAWSDGLGIPDRFVRGWHVDAICEHLEAVSAGEIRRLAICVPPGSSKSTVASICWPAWEWTRKPTRRFVSASYDRTLATTLTRKSRMLIESDWYQARWSAKFSLRTDQNTKEAFENTRGGYRLSVPTNFGTGFHGDILVIDDPHKASDVNSNAKRKEVLDWHAGTVSTRFTSGEGQEVIIAQRLHEMDLIGYVLAQAPEFWTVLCLPERFEGKHPQRTPHHVRLPSGRLIKGDCREVEGELLCPARRDEKEHQRVLLEQGSFRAAGQLQQRPAAREGEILKRHYWKFFPESYLEDDGLKFLPKFHGLVQSWDTAFRDKTQNDFVVGLLIGLVGPHLRVLAMRKDRMNLSQTKQAMREMTAYAEKRWPRLPLRILVENTANGPLVIAELRNELRGVVPVNLGNADKVARAEAAEPAFEGGNVWLPGESDDDMATFYDPVKTPAWAQEIIESAAVFPNGEHDDIVDALTQAVNWSRGAGRRSRATFGRPRGVMPERGQMAVAGQR